MLRVSGLRDACETLFGLSDLFLPSGEELFLFTRAETEEAAIADLLARGPRAIVHKRGASGALYCDRTSRVVQPGFAVDEVDPTGAGDCFGATFVSGWLRDWTPERALAYAAASGALAVTRLGPMEGAASQDDLDTFLRSRGIEVPA